MGNLKYPIINGKKECGKCHEFKTLDSFYKHNNYYRSYCKKCNTDNTNHFRRKPKNKTIVSEYGKKYLKRPENKIQKYNTTKLWVLNQKRKAVDYKGGKCIVCGYNKCLEALEFHHKNPLEKDIKLKSSGINRRQSFEKSKEELDKCVLLCCRCHREVHADLIKLEDYL
jgi:hypothetical protein